MVFNESSMSDLQGSRADSLPDTLLHLDLQGLMSLLPKFQTRSCPNGWLRCLPAPTLALFWQSQQSLFLLNEYEENKKRNCYLIFFFFELQPKMHTFKKSNAYCDWRKRYIQEFNSQHMNAEEQRNCGHFLNFFHGTCVLKWLVNSSVVVCVYIILSLVEFPFHQKLWSNIPTGSQLTHCLKLWMYCVFLP